jgi:hypothetical protein
MSEWTEKLKKENIDLHKMLKRQLSYAGLLLKSVCDNIKDDQLRNKIVDDHLNSCAKWDQQNNE